MSNMTIKTFQNIMNKLFASGGNTVIHGKHAYCLHKPNDVIWVAYLPYDEYKKNRKHFDNSPVGWNALVRIA